MRGGVGWQVTMALTVLLLACVPSGRTAATRDREPTQRCRVSHSREPGQAVGGKYLAIYYQGVAKYRLGDFDEARRLFENAIELDPKLPGPWRWLAVIAQAELRFQDCIEAAANALCLNPTSPHAATVRNVWKQCEQENTRDTSFPVGPLVQDMKSQNITISTLGIGDADTYFLQMIAQTGGGRFQTVEETRELPRVFADEVRLAKAGRDHQ